LFFPPTFHAMQSIAQTDMHPVHRALIGFLAPPNAELSGIWI